MTVAEHLEFKKSESDQEIKEIGRCFENTKNNIGSIKFITGPYGSGKTFLLNYKDNIF